MWQWFSIGESTRKAYVKQMNTPPLSTDSCNATANYAGSLPDDSVCIEDAGNENDTKCQINVSLSHIPTLFEALWYPISILETMLIWFLKLMFLRLTKELRYCVIRVQNHHGKWKEYLAIEVVVVDMHFRLFILNSHHQFWNGSRKQSEMTWWLNDEMDETPFKR